MLVMVGIDDTDDSWQAAEIFKYCQLIVWFGSAAAQRMRVCQTDSMSDDSNDN